MKVTQLALLVVIGLLGWVELSTATPSVTALLDIDLPPPPQHHAATPAPDASLLAVSTSTQTSVGASLAAKIAAESALAVDESVIHAAAVEDLVTAAGQLSAEDEALIAKSKMVPVAHTSIPSDPAIPIEYMAPPTRDELSTNLGPRGYPWEEKLQNALNTVQSTAQAKIGTIKKQMKWSTAANKLVQQLGLKKNKVVLHVQELTNQIKDLLGKKKQIQNKILQDKLVERLENTHNNLKKVRRQTHNIRKNQAKMIHHKEELAHALEGIKRSLAILKGMQRKRQFPSRGVGAKMEDELSKFDPDLSFEKEADEVRALQFPDAVLAETGSEAETEVEEESTEEVPEAEEAQTDDSETVMLEVDSDLSGPYEDIQQLLASAEESSASLAALDTPGRPRLVTIHHHHRHVVPHGMPRHVAQRIAEANTPAPPRVRIIQAPNRAQQARHAREDAAYAQAVATPAVQTLTVANRVTVNVPQPSVYWKKGQGPKKADGKPEYHFPLVDRRLQRPTYSIIADTDGSDKASPDWKPHTAAELQAEAKRLLTRAQKLKAKKAAAKKNAEKEKAEREAMGVFDQLDSGYEDELTRLKRVSARMNRLREQIEEPHPQDSFEGSIARKKYFLKIYTQLKSDATKIIEGYALRTGNSIFELFGNGKLDPSIAAFLPPNSVAGILAQYANPTRGRDDETPRDVISGKDAKRIQYASDYHKAKTQGTRLPLPPVYALTDEEAAANAKHNNPLFNKVIATQQGAFGQGRPAITTGNQAIGRSSVHISVVNPTETQDSRGMPYQVNLQTNKHTKLN